MFSMDWYDVISKIIAMNCYDSSIVEPLYAQLICCESIIAVGEIRNIFQLDPGLFLCKYKNTKNKNVKRVENRK